jgi:hypothetical protein
LILPPPGVPCQLVAAGNGTRRRLASHKLGRPSAAPRYGRPFSCGGPDQDKQASPSRVNVPMYPPVRDHTDWERDGVTTSASVPCRHNCPPRQRDLFSLSPLCVSSENAGRCSFWSQRNDLLLTTLAHMVQADGGGPNVWRPSRRSPARHTRRAVGLRSRAVGGSNRAIVGCHEVIPVPI